MCGIIGVASRTAVSDRSWLTLGRDALRHRGPDWTGIWADERAIMAHERLAIVDPEGGAQPLRDPDDRRILAVNGEIYNHRALRQSLAAPYAFRTGSDCEVILPLYAREGPRLLQRLRGMFAFALYDAAKDDWLIARDPIGIVPLYVGRRKDGSLAVASELKALATICDSIEEFPPGHYQTRRDPKPVRYYARDWFDFDAVPDREVEPAEIREALADAVFPLGRKEGAADRPAAPDPRAGVADEEAGPLTVLEVPEAGQESPGGFAVQ